MQSTSSLLCKFQNQFIWNGWISSSSLIPSRIKTAKQGPVNKRKSAKQTWRIQTKIPTKKLPYPLCITWTTHIFGESTLANHILHELAHVMSQKQMTILHELHKTSPWHQAPNFPWAQWKESNKEVWGADNYPPNQLRTPKYLGSFHTIDIICRKFWNIDYYFFQRTRMKKIYEFIYIYIYIYMTWTLQN